MSKFPVLSKVHFHQHSAPAPSVRLFKSTTKRLPTVTKTMWAKIESAARVPHKDRQYPEIVEVPDGSI